jgi:chemotaxis protein methyltransferase CheR
MEGQSGVSSSQPYPVDELAGDPWYSRLKDYLIGATGLSYYADKDADLARRIRRRFAALGVEDCASYLERLQAAGQGPAEMDALIAQITIGETYFFRHREHFDALRDTVLPDLIARNAESRQLRIWCAGCADGAEPYSLSILLQREMAHLVAGWNISILGTDINRQCIKTASEGRFEEWCLRATPADIREACFIEKGKHWILAPRYREGVSFQFHNLVETAFPSSGGEFSGFDLIVCRNVMIYFCPELMRKVVGQFREALQPAGWLLVGPSEPNMTFFTSFRALNAPGVTLYQRAHDSAKPTSLPLASFPLPTEPPAPVVSTHPPDPVTTETVRAVPTLADLRRLADQGDWEGAARCGRELQESDNLNASVHFNCALVLEQMGDAAESERSFRRAIYLDRQAAQAHYHLGVLMQSRGELRQARRCFDNVLRVLTSRPGDLILADADGITAAELSKLAQMRMEALKEQL